MAASRVRICSSSAFDGKSGFGMTGGARRSFPIGAGPVATCVLGDWGFGVAAAAGAVRLRQSRLDLELTPAARAKVQAEPRPPSRGERAKSGTLHGFAGDVLRYVLIGLHLLDAGIAPKQPNNWWNADTLELRGALSSCRLAAKRLMSVHPGRNTTLPLGPRSASRSL